MELTEKTCGMPGCDEKATFVIVPGISDGHGAPGSPMAALAEAMSSVYELDKTTTPFRYSCNRHKGDDRSVTASIFGWTVVIVRVSVPIVDQAEYEPCLRCDGEGNVREFGARRWRTITCADCDGSGRVLIDR